MRDPREGEGGEQAMAEVKAADNGPLIITGEIELVDGEGNKLETKEKTFLCRCGHASKKPFCDGSHKGKFESAVRS